MADIVAHPDRVTVELEWWEKIAAHRSDLTVPLRSVAGIDCLEDVFDDPAVAAGERAPATRIRGVTVTGTLDDPDGPGTVFAVCHGSTGNTPGVAIRLTNATVERIVVSHSHPGDVVARLCALTGLGGDEH